MKTYAHDFALFMSGREYERPSVPDHLRLFVTSVTPSLKVFVVDGIAHHYPPTLLFADGSQAVPNHLGVYLAYAPNRFARLRTVF